MAKKPIDEKELQMAKDFYRLYDIAEWHEKSTILSTEEKSRALTDLKNGTPSELVAMLKCPFPTFCRLYFGQYPSSETWFSDPEMAYKLYFLDDSQLRFMAETIRHPEMSIKEIAKVYNLSKISYSEASFIKNIRLEEFPKIMSSNGVNKANQKKFTYLTQYIDATEANRMGLSISKIFERDQVNGYDLEGKLAILNPAARLIISLYLGLYGEKRHQIKDIGKKLHISVKIVDKFIDMIFPRMTQTLGEFQNSLGFHPELQVPGNMFEYTNRPFRELDIAIETQFIYGTLPEADKLVLSAYSNKDLKIYLAQKYMFKTPESLARNLVLSLNKAQKIFF